MKPVSSASIKKYCIVTSSEVCNFKIYTSFNIYGKFCGEKSDITFLFQSLNRYILDEPQGMFSLKLVIVLNSDLQNEILKVFGDTRRFFVDNQHSVWRN